MQQPAAIEVESIFILASTSPNLKRMDDVGRTEALFYLVLLPAELPAARRISSISGRLHEASSR